MIALLHYAWIKGMRDRSLLIFALIPPIQFTFMVLGFSVAMRNLSYPFTPPDWTGDFPGFAIVFPSLFGSISAFWALRAEVATRAVDSFVVASRPIAVIGALVVIGTVTGAGGWIGGLVTIVALTADLPANVLSLASNGALAALAGASLGALYVTILPQPTMLIWAIVAGFPLAPWIFSPASGPWLMPVALSVSVVAVVTSTLLLRRRCAS
jgi:hypothetical protein